MATYMQQGSSGKGSSRLGISCTRCTSTVVGGGGEALNFIR